MVVDNSFNTGGLGIGGAKSKSKTNQCKDQDVDIYIYIEKLELEALLVLMITAGLQKLKNEYENPPARRNVHLSLAQYLSLEFY